MRPLISLLLLTVSTQAADWTIETLAGTGTQGFSGDGGPAIKADLDNPFGIVRGPDGAHYYCEYTGQRIRKISADGIISTIAGTGAVGFTGDGGPALQATFSKPHELRFDAQGDMFIVDMVNHAIRKIDMKTGILTTLAGNGQPGYSGDGGPAKNAQFKQPHSIQFGPEGDLYVCDIGNHVIRKIDMKTGLISTFAGTGKAGPTPDGSPIAGTPLKGPRSLDFDTQAATSGSPPAKAIKSSSLISKPASSTTSPAPAKAASPATAAPPKTPPSPAPKASPSTPKATSGSPTAKATPSA
jgi:hypothetical protein